MGTEKSEHTRSQNKKILEYLESGRSITPTEALNMFDCMRLSARINDLRADGHLIKTVRCKRKNKEGHTVSYAEYSLEE